MARLQAWPENDVVHIVDQTLTFVDNRPEVVRQVRDQARPVIEYTLDRATDAIRGVIVSGRWARSAQRLHSLRRHPV